MATAQNVLHPAAAAVNTAVLSAQFVRPKERFSIFAPVMTVPSDISSAAPTGNFEYGEYEFFDALSAASKRPFICFSETFITHTSDFYFFSGEYLFIIIS